jgi:hypothetical protein
MRREFIALLGGVAAGGACGRHTHTISSSSRIHHAVVQLSATMPDAEREPADCFAVARYRARAARCGIVLIRRDGLRQYSITTQ